MIKSAMNVVDAFDAGVALTVRAPDVEMAGVFLQPGTWEIAAPARRYEAIPQQP
jgi:hypothetical protein